MDRYVYVASSWRNPLQPVVCAALAEAGVDHYDFRNPPGGPGFSWRHVKTDEPSISWCKNCANQIYHARYRDTPGSRPEPDYDPAADPVTWRHFGGYAGCRSGGAAPGGVKAKGSDWEQVDEYLRMVSHPVAQAGFEADYGAMKRADTVVMILPCGKSAHLELGWAVGAGKRTAILLEDPVEPELMYRMVDRMMTDIDALVRWVCDRSEMW